MVKEENLMKNISRIIVALAVILISVSITSIPVKAETAAEKWLRQKREEKERYMDELEADGNLTQEAIDSITQGQSKRKPNKKTSTSKSSSNYSYSSGSTYSGEARGWVYSCDELHIIGLPEDPTTGYTRSGDYGRID